MPVHVIGMGGAGRKTLSEGAIRQILSADLLIGSARLLADFADYSGPTLTITNNVKEVAEVCGKAENNVVVLGSGDPNFFGIGRYLLGKLGPERVRIHPGPSSMQEAFALAGLAWHDAVFGSCHGKPPEGIVALVRENAKVGLFTDDTHTPAVIAKTLLAGGIPDIQAVVCGNLGLPGEVVMRGRLSEIATREMPDLTVLILLHDTPPARPLRIGLPEEAFHQRKPKAGLITKREVRAVAISKMALSDRAVVWDIGAGSGSVAIECAMIAHRGQVYAIEKNADDIENIVKNIAAFGLSNLTPVHATAPEGLETLPDPDAVFVGGTGGRLDALLDACLARLAPGGTLTMTLVTLENLAAAHEYFKSRGIPLEITQISAARGVPILEMTRLEAQNPVTLLHAEKPGATPARPAGASPLNES